MNAELRQGRSRLTLLGVAGAVGVTVLVLAGAPSVAGSQQQASAPPSVVFDGVTVVDVEHGKLIPDQRVVITGNRIEKLGSTSSVSIPKGAQIVPAKDKYLIPGLWDMHTHRGYTPNPDASVIDYLLPLANGVTGIRDAYSNFVPLDSQVLWRKEILAGTRVGPPRQLLAGPKINKLSDEDIAGLKARGADFLKVYPFTPHLAVAARRAGLLFGGHVGDRPTDTTSAIEASDSGITILDHVYSGGLDTICAGPDASVERCQLVAERFRRNNTWWVPTMYIAVPIAIGWAGPATRAVLTRLEEVTHRFWNDSTDHGNWLRTPEMLVDSTADSTGFLRIARQVGLPLLVGTDADGSLGQLQSHPKGFAIHAELAISVFEGLTPLEALQTATLNPAKMLHATDSLGTVAQGKLADLVLLDADPLADITNTTTIRAVVANGRYFDRAALDSFLTEVRNQVRRMEAKEEGKKP